MRISFHLSLTLCGTLEPCIGISLLDILPLSRLYLKVFMISISTIAHTRHSRPISGSCVFTTTKQGYTR